MDDHPFLPWFALNRLPGLGPVAQRQLLDRAGGMAGLCSISAAQLTAWLPPEAATLWQDFLARRTSNNLLQQALRDAEGSTCSEAILLCCEDARYPVLLAQTRGAPTLLYVRGNPDALHLPQLAVVGSRSASASGLELAAEFASALARHGLAITSGLALGVDAAAHNGALAVQGVTLAVIATGIDEIYPRRHEALAQEIIAGGGAIVTEFAPGTAPQAQYFPRRNRIISGLSLGTLVVEASPQSGSLITARCAMEQGREVFALPGSVRSVFHRGCHALIREGATLVETTQDIVDELGSLLAFKQRECAQISSLRAQPDLAGDALRLFQLLDHTPVALDVLVERSQWPVERLSAALMDLEMEGVAVQQHGLFSRR